MAKSRRVSRRRAPVARRSNKFGYRIEHWIIFGVSCLVAGFLISTFIQGSGASNRISNEKGKPWQITPTGVTCATGGIRLSGTPCPTLGQ